MSVVAPAFAQYKLNENAANTSVVDTGFGGNDGVAIVNTDQLSVAGKLNQAFEFNGTSEYVNVNTLAVAIAGDKVGSVSFWLNAYDVGGGVVFAISNVASKNLIRLNVGGPGAGTALYGAHYIAGAEVLTWNTPLGSVTPSVWSHAVIVQEGSRIRCYINGVEQSISKTAVGIGESSWMADLVAIDTGRVGCESYNGGGNSFFLAGKVDDLRYYKRPLTPNEVLALYNEGNGTEDVVMTYRPQFRSLIGEPIPYAHYKLNDNAASLTVADAGTGSNNGTASVNTSVLSVAGKINSAFNFDGSSQYVNVNTLVANILTDTKGSICCWIYPEAVGGNFFAIGDADALTLMSAQVAGGNRITGYLVVPGVEKWQFDTPNDSVPLSVWSHVVVTQDGKRVRCYLNGQEQELSYANNFDVSVWLAGMTGLDTGRIGCRNYNSGSNTHFFDGKIDDVRYYSNVALSDEAIKAIYGETADLLCGEPTNGVGTEDSAPRVETGVPYAQYKLNDSYLGLLDSGLGSNQALLVQNDTKLLLHFDRAVPAGYYDFVDETKRHGTNGIITGTNGVQIDTTQHKFGVSSCKFDGINDYISIADSADWDMFASNTDDWTIAFWFKHASLVGNQQYVQQYESTSAYNSFIFTPATVVWQVKLATVTAINLQNAVISDTTWHYLAAVKKGSNYGLYLDGTLVSQVTTLLTDTFIAPLLIGANFTYGEPFNGNMDDLVIAQRNLFDAKPYDVGALWNIDGAQGATAMIDSGFYGHSATFVGNAHIDAGFGKFRGSGRFDGVDDFVRFGDDSDWDIVASVLENWTIELWVKHASVTGDDTYVYQFEDASNWWLLYNNIVTGLTFDVRSGGIQIVVVRTPGAAISDTSSWHHVALIKIGSEYGIYLDGAQIAYTNDSSVDTFSGKLYVGTAGNVPETSPSSLFHGYMDDVRIQKSNFYNAAPNVGLTNTITIPDCCLDGNCDTKLLLHFDGNFEDSSVKSHTATLYNGVLATSGDAVDKTGSSLALDGTLSGGLAVSYVSVADHAAWDVTASATGDWTIDLWVKHFDYTKTDEGYIGQDNGGDYWEIRHRGGEGIRFHVVQSATPIITTGTYQYIADNDWHHVAMVKRDDKYAIYLDGVQTNFTQDSSVLNLTGQLTLGSVLPSVGGVPLYGNLDDVRMTKGNLFDADPALYSLLLNFDGFNGANVTTIDEGTSKKTVTFNGGAYIDTGIAKFGGALRLIGGQYITVPDSVDWAFGTSDFTIDFWVCFSGLTGNQNIGGSQQQDASNNWALYKYEPGNKLGFDWMQGGVTVASYIMTNVWDVQVETWYHIALVRSGTVLKMYINGVSQALTTYTAIGTTSLNDLAAVLRIGDHIADMDMKGWLDEYRISNVARWTSDFTPCQDSGWDIFFEPHVADSNTVLLLHFDKDLRDSSFSAHVPTGYGNPIITAQPKIGLGSYNWHDNEAKYNGALKFNGTNQYLTIPDHADWAFGAGNFTIDCWIKFQNLALRQTIYSQYISGINSAYWFVYAPASQIEFAHYVGAVYETRHIASWLPVVNTWYHLALVRKGTTDDDWDMYVDGRALGMTVQTNSGGTLSDLAAPVYIGQLGDSTFFLNGWLDDFRVLKGTARWTADFDPCSTDDQVFNAPFNDYGYNSLLLHFDGSYEDLNSEPHVVTAYNSPVFTYRRPEAGSLSLDGVTGYLSLVDNPDWDVFASASEEWTVDCWVKLQSFGGNMGIVGQCQSGTDQWFMFLEPSGGGLVFWVYVGGTQVIQCSGGNGIHDFDWHHIAMIKSGSEYGLYIDGVQQSHTSDVSTATFSAPLEIGRRGDGTNYLHGKIDGLRIAKKNVFNVVPASGYTGGAANFMLPTSAPTTDTIQVPTSKATVDTFEVPTEQHKFTVTSLLDRGIRLNGVDEYVNCDELCADIKSDGVGTIALWVKADAVRSGTQTLFSVGDTVGSYAHLYMALAADATITCRLVTFGGGFHWIVQGTEYLEADEWYHVVLVQDGTYPKVYINGKLDYETNNVTNPTAWLKAEVAYLDNGRLGCRNTGGSGNYDFLKGTLDDFRYYKYALSAEEIYSLYNKGLGTERIPLVSECLKTFLSTRSSVGIDDSYINAGSPATNYGSGVLAYIGKDAVNINRGITKALELTDVTRRLNVVAAKLYAVQEVDVSDNSATVDQVRVYELKRNWDEAQVTWNEYRSGKSWTTAGVGSIDYDYALTPDSVLQVGEWIGLGVSTRDLANVSAPRGIVIDFGIVGRRHVEDMIKRDEPDNFGFLLKNIDESAVSHAPAFSTVEATLESKRPYYEIVYEELPPENKVQVRTIG